MWLINDDIVVSSSTRIGAPTWRKTDSELVLFKTVNEGWNGQRWKAIVQPNRGAHNYVKKQELSAMFHISNVGREKIENNEWKRVTPDRRRKHSSLYTVELLYPGWEFLIISSPNAAAFETWIQHSRLTTKPAIDQMPLGWLVFLTKPSMVKCQW